MRNFGSLTDSVGNVLIRHLIWRFWIPGGKLHVLAPDFNPGFGGTGHMINQEDLFWGILSSLLENWIGFVNLIDH